MRTLARKATACRAARLARRRHHPICCAGDWKTEKDWVVFEKPRGLFENTLYLSAQLQQPTAEQPKLKLVKGNVHVAEPVEGSDPNDPDPECAPHGALLLPTHFGRRC